MTPLLDGHVRIAAIIADGAVIDATVACHRPRGVGAALTRRPAAEIPAIAGRLFALCSVSQSAAARAASAAAGAAVETDDPAETHAALAAERLVEHLRATVLGLGGAVPLTPQEAAAVRTVLAKPHRPAREALERLGLGPDAAPLHMQAGAKSQSWAGRLMAFAAALDAETPDAVDALTADDDAAVAAALLETGEAFAAAPHLPGRRPEAGPLARATASRRMGAGGAARLAARFAEIAEIARNGALAAGRSWIRAERMSPGVGFAAVESPRGRLHHVAEIDRQGRIMRYLILAPTEWNFAPEGPFAQALRRLRTAEDAPAAPAIETLAALFDPCVACRVSVSPAPSAETAQELAHA
ncbi:nickel-dependent hydrogenase large subunit [Blastochloris tepida]|uniref:Hydrogenase expression/formation protein HupK n=1 Tax=Blastochloris tepida TaxID=2233851 RepID=A0A348G365_9HYPH|nr:nickel-dependent hydrogenase large subunit [Blastochloris tepida]BBF93998.1 hydrogenase expression/formation protein HupK [Blastochloris tepida]